MPRLLRVKEVTRTIGVSRSTLYNWISNGYFPKPITLADRIKVWEEETIHKWISTKRDVHMY